MAGEDFDNCFWYPEFVPAIALIMHLNILLVCIFTVLLSYFLLEIRLRQHKSKYVLKRKPCFTRALLEPQI